MLAKTLEDVSALRRNGRAQEALALLNVVRQKENAPALLICMAEIFSELGVEAGAEQVLLEGLKTHPQDAALRLNLANHYYRVDRAMDGIKALAPLGENVAPEILLTRAALLKASGDEAGARAGFEKILQNDPKNIAALANLGDMALDARDYKKAAALFEQALAQNKNNTHVLNKLSAVYFRDGELEKAWQAYEARFGIGENDPFATARRRPYSQPLWNGEKLADGKMLLLYGEQGVGEEIMHASMLSDAAALADNTLTDNIIVECDARLAPLFARSFSNIRFAPRHEKPVTDPAIAYQVPLGHLGVLFRTDFESFPKRENYLKADAQKTAAIRAQYERLAEGKKIIGVSWKSKKLRHGDPKSTSLEHWNPVFDTGNFFVDLQYGATPDERAGYPLYLDPAIDQQQSLDDYASQIAALDGVITVSNTAAHVAGALGIKTAVLLPASRGLMPHWFDNGEKSPWYSSVTLLRQTKDGVWDDVMPRAASFIKTL
jgi:tetratricopeptide (TPR) repeat protein